MDAVIGSDTEQQAARPSSKGWRPPGCDRVALVLQGGGALGAYQAGVYHALHKAGIEPDWIIGTSIGAVWRAAESTVPSPPSTMAIAMPGWKLDGTQALWPWVRRC